MLDSILSAVGNWVSFLFYILYILNCTYLAETPSTSLSLQKPFCLLLRSAKPVLFYSTFQIMLPTREFGPLPALLTKPGWGESALKQFIEPRIGVSNRDPFQLSTSTQQYSRIYWAIGIKWSETPLHLNIMILYMCYIELHHNEMYFDKFYGEVRRINVISL